MFKPTYPDERLQHIIEELDSLLQNIDGRIEKSLLIGGRKKLGMAPQPRTLTGGQLKDYQRQCLAWMCQLADHNLNGILADDMGLGKTIQTISYFCYLYEHKKIKGKHLIVVPKNVLMNWLRQINRWSKNHHVVILPGTEAERMKVLEDVVKKKKFDILITTYQSVQSAQNVLRKIFWETLVVDEAHSIKNDETCLSYSLRRYRAKFTLLLTGTPLSNELHELWSLLNFILPDIFTNPTFFDRIQYCVNNANIEEQQKIRLQIQISQKFHRMLNPFLLRRTKSQIKLGLKEKKEITLFVSLSQLQVKMYRNFLKLKNVFGAPNQRQLNRQVQLRKICAHPYMFPEMEDPNSPPYGDHLITNSGKMKVLDKLIHKLLKENHKILIFSQFTSMLKILEDYLHYLELKFCIITGESSLRSRQASVQNFSESKDANIFLISTRAGGIGLNLIAASVVIIYDIDWNPQMDRQAMDRAYRIGQTKSVKVFKFISMSTIQQRMLQIQKYKLLWDQLVIQKGGLTKLHGQKTGEQKFGKIDYDKIAETGAEDIFKLQDNFDDKTVQQIIKYGEQKDHAKTKQIREKLQKQFQKFNKEDYNLDIYDNKTASSIEDIKYGPEKVGFFKKDQVQKSKSSYFLSKNKQFVEPQPFHLFSNINEAGNLLYKLNNANQNEKQICQIRNELNKLGFYNWSKLEYQRFAQANLKLPKQQYNDIAVQVQTKSIAQVIQYSERFYEVVTKNTKTLKQSKKILKKQEELQFDQEINKLEKRVKAIPKQMIKVSSKYHTNHLINLNAINIFQANTIAHSDVNYQQISPIFKKLYPNLDKNHNNKTKLKKHRFLNKIIQESESINQNGELNYEQEEKKLQNQFKAIKISLTKNIRESSKEDSNKTEIKKENKTKK